MVSIPPRRVERISCTQRGVCPAAAGQWHFNSALVRLSQRDNNRLKSVEFDIVQICNLFRGVVCGGVFPWF